MFEENICRSYKYALINENFLTDLGGGSVGIETGTEHKQANIGGFFFSHFKIVYFPYLIIFLIWSDF